MIALLFFHGLENAVSHLQHCRAACRPFTLLHNDMLQGAAGQFFCEDEDTSAMSSSGADDECVFRDDTLVLLEMTTRDMMEVRISSCIARVSRQNCTVLTKSRSVCLQGYRDSWLLLTAGG